MKLIFKSDANALFKPNLAKTKGRKVFVKPFCPVVGVTGHGFAAQILRSRRPLLRTVTASNFAAKNNSPDCFLYRLYNKCWGKSK